MDAGIRPHGNGSGGRRAQNFSLDGPCRKAVTRGPAQPRRPRPRDLKRGSLQRPHCKLAGHVFGLSTVRALSTRPPPADRQQSCQHALVLPSAGTHSMTIRCFVSQPFSMENQGDRAMIATGSFEEWDAFREA